MNLKYITSLTLLTLLISCSNDSEENSSQNGMFSENQASELADLLNSPNENNNERIIEESTIGDKSKDQFDSTHLIGTWVIHDSDLSVLEYPYVGGMPESFNIYDLNQINHGLLRTKFETPGYPFMINKIDKDSLILYLHPAGCKCEGLEARYRKK